MSFVVPPCPLSPRRRAPLAQALGGLIATCACHAALASAAPAPDWVCDVDDYAPKAIGIEEPWLENSLTLAATMASDRFDALGLAPSLEARLGPRIGLEVDLPELNWGPGMGRGVAGPMTLGVKYAALQHCDLGRGRATLVTFELEGQAWTDRRPALLPGAGDAISAQVMWTHLDYPWFNHGEAGYTQRLGHGASSGWFVTTSVGRSLSATVSAQLEVGVDNQGVRDDGSRGRQSHITPQVSWRFRPAWMVAFGEQVALNQGSARPEWSTLVLLEHEF